MHLGRDAYLDNCKLALMTLIGVGHAAQWLLALEDGRTGRGWCGGDGKPSSDWYRGGGRAVVDGDGDGDNDASPSPTASSSAVTVLRALYTWSNAIAIPMFCVISGHLSRSLVSPVPGGREDVALLSRMRRNAEALLVPFFIFQGLACAVETASPPLRRALAPHDGGGDGDPSTHALAHDATWEAAATLDLWTPHISWYLLALYLWRAALPVFAQLRPAVAAALAAALGLGVGFTNTGAATGYFLKWGTVWGNFPYFALGCALTSDRYRAVRDAGWVGRAGGAITTLATLAALLRGLAGHALCFDAWQWEAWKSAPYVHYNRPGFMGGDRGADVDADADVGARTLAAAVLFRAATYVGAVAAGIAFLVVLPRSHLPFVSPLGARTVYGYLLHAPALLGVMALLGVFDRAGKENGLGEWEMACFGVAVPVLVTAACMSRPAQACFWWMCEPSFGEWVWRPKEDEGWM